MRLSSFQITKYRNIQDSGEISIDDDLSCIVGKNQSGKTALLRALHGFNPKGKDHYDLRRDWPRSERGLRNPKQIVCRAVFILEDSEQIFIRALAPEITSSTVTITKDYEGLLEIHFSEQPRLLDARLHPNPVDHLCEELQRVHPNAGESFRGTADECIVQVQRLAREGRYTELRSIPLMHQQVLRARLTEGKPQHQREIEFCNDYDIALNAIIQEVERLPTLRRDVHDYVVGKMPAFIYMDEFREFNGTAQLSELRHRLRNNTSTPSDQTFLMLLKLANLSLDTLIAQGTTNDENAKQERLQDVADASVALTRDMAGRWVQNGYEIEFRVDGQNFFTHIRQEGKLVGMIPLEEQSKGFRWFLSFDLRFMHDSNGTFRNCVLLLDEPGLHLHPGGQQDLIKRLEAYAEHNTLLYTTHLPFLIDLREPQRIKVIMEHEGNAIVTTDLSSAGPDEKLTLQAALGIKLSQHYLIAPRNLIVEGAHDYWIITELANLFERCGQEALPGDVMITAAGSASEAVYLATFMIGQELEVVTLFDSDSEGRRQEERLRTKWLTRYKGTRATNILLGPAVRAAHDFAIEDLFDQDYYIECAVASHGEKLRSINLSTINPTGSGPLCERVARGCEHTGILFNKGSVANMIKKRLIAAKTLNDLPTGTSEKARDLFTAIRNAFRHTAQASGAG
jgi:hypothetical protein